MIFKGLFQSKPFYDSCYYPSITQPEMWTRTKTESLHLLSVVLASHASSLLPFWHGQFSQVNQIWLVSSSLGTHSSHVGNRSFKIGVGTPGGSIFTRGNTEMKFSLWIQRKIFQSENVNSLTSSNWRSAFEMPCYRTFSINKNKKTT